MYLPCISYSLAKYAVSLNLLSSPVGGPQGAEGLGITLKGEKAYEFLQNLDSDYLSKIKYENFTEGGRDLLDNIDAAIDHLLKAANIEVEIKYSPPREDFPVSSDAIKIKIHEIVNDKRNRTLMVNFNDERKNGVTDGVPDFVNITEKFGKTTRMSSKDYGKLILEPAVTYFKDVKKRLNIQGTTHK